MKRIFRVRNLRKEKSKEDTDYDNLKRIEKMRTVRKEQSGKAHLLRNLEAKKGMRLLKEEGRLRKFVSRAPKLKKGQSSETLFEYRKYFEKSEGHKQKLKKMEPDIVEKINEKIRLEKEDEIQRKKKESNEYEIDESEICCCDFDTNCEYCEKLFEDDKMINELAPSITEEELRKFEDEELEEYQRMKKIERNRKHREKLEGLKKPAPPLPTRELCEYEKIRDRNIAEREKEWAIYEKEWDKKNR